LLDGLDGEFQKPVFPGSEIGTGPVAVDPFNAGYAVFGNLVQKAFNNSGLGVVRVDKNREFRLKALSLMTGKW
jgi:hypothetical protein